MENFDDIFNLTMTYKRDSDLYLPYGTATRLYNELYTENITWHLDNLTQQKSKLALWIASNKYTRGARERMQLTDLLIDAGLDLDRRGSLFPNASKIPNGRGLQFIHFIRSYKFYMSFENQWHCKDYFTEKVWNNGFRAESVPVVWGARKRDYIAALPPGSFIFASDYTPTELVEYLKYLNQNDTAYREYFSWRTMEITEMPDYGRATGFCQLCRIMHGINIDNIFNPLYNEKYSSIPLFEKPKTARVVHSLKAAYYDTDHAECH